MQRRYYDPVGFTASNPMMFNRYAYANNNPYKFVDPDGGEPDDFQWLSWIQNPSTYMFSSNQAAALNRRFDITPQLESANNAIASIVPADPSGVLLGSSGVVLSIKVSLTGAGVPLGAVGLGVSLDSIRNSWTGERTLLGLGAEFAANKVGLTRISTSAGNAGDSITHMVSGPGAAKNIIKGTGTAAVAMSAVSTMGEAVSIMGTASDSEEKPRIE